MTKIVVASHNKGKLRELNRILSEQFPAIELVSYDGPEPRETGTSFVENAFIKARAAAAHTGLPAIADDSGISVDVLGGSPGIFSARWAGNARFANDDPDRANLNLLLEQLSDIDAQYRSASFVCAAAFVMPASGASEAIEASEVGIWSGQILTEPTGEHGFGYDPIFRPDGSTLSAAQLSPEQKNADSHRTRAFSALSTKIAKIL